MSGDPNDLYAVLGIARDATPAAVKAAYFRLARVHTPEDDPERFREISNAYEVLSDPAARLRYDAEERLPAPVVAALQRAGELAAQSPDEAVAAAKSVLAEHGASPLVRFCVAQACLRARRPKEAIPLAEELCREDPARADYAHFLGDACLADGRVKDAERALNAALAIDPNRIGVYLSLSDAHNAWMRTDDALMVLDRGLRLDGDGATMRLMPLRIRKLMILGQDGRWAEMERVVAAIVSAVPAGDEDAVQHTVSQLSQLAQRCDEARVWDTAKFLIDAALRLAPHEGLAARAKEIAPWAAAQREARLVYTDRALPDWIKAMVRGRLGAEMSDDIWRKLCDDIVEAIASNLARAYDDWAVFRRLYPHAAQKCAEMFDRLREAATPARSAGRTASRVVSAGASAARARSTGRSGTRREPVDWSGARWVLGAALVFAIWGMRLCSMSSQLPPEPAFDSTKWVAPSVRADEQREEAMRKQMEAARRKLLDDVRGKSR